MARFRNPVFAPQWLETRLNPSSLVVSAEIRVADDTPKLPPTDPFPTDPNGDPIPYPIPLPDPGPVGPG